MKKLNRFTTIPVLFDMIRRRRVVLMSPALWPDKNDSELMREYKIRKKLKRLFAICFSCGDETIHHWNAYAGTNGCCIEFDLDSLLAAVNKHKGIRHDYVTYKKLKDVSPGSIDIGRIPFTKRWPYQCENEYRVIWEGKSSQSCYEIEIDLRMIRKITISQQVPRHVFLTIRDQLREVLPAVTTKINHSTIYKNRKWINRFKASANKIAKASGEGNSQ
jgi:hypothetical protein